MNIIMTIESQEDCQERILMSKLVVLSGIPGAGKTTYAHNYGATKVVSNDEIRFKITKGKFPGQFI